VIAGVLLAAGSGTRFGSHKLLHPLPDGTPLVIAALRALREGVDEVIAVVRPGDAVLRELLEKEQAKVIACEHAARGMGASLACGVRASPEADGWLIALGDMPHVPPTIVANLAQTLRSGAAIVAPTCHGRRGHPVGFDRRFYAELARLDDDVGARHIIAAHASELVLLPCAEPGVLRDIDTPDALANFSKADAASGG
jgi:molybdenum cofactor cytidylyltransferase